MPTTPFPKSGEPLPAAPPEDNEQAPLGAQPSYDDVLDVAVQYTFPASDPIAVVESSAAGGARVRPEREEGAEKGPGSTPGHGEGLAS
jgi:hypothetical protein